MEYVTTDTIVMDKLGYPQIEYIRKSDLTDDAIDRIAEAVAKKIENLCKNCQEFDCSWCRVKRQRGGRRMTSYKFEVAAKNAVMDVILKNHDEVFTIKDLSLVWFACILGCMKAIIVDNGQNNRLYEVTYDIEEDEMYVDEYNKSTNTVFYSNMIDTEVR